MGEHFLFKLEIGIHVLRRNLRFRGSDVFSRSDVGSESIPENWLESPMERNHSQPSTEIRSSMNERTEAE